jgi:hypothetical protein
MAIYVISAAALSLLFPIFHRNSSINIRTDDGAFLHIRNFFRRHLFEILNSADVVFHLSLHAHAANGDVKAWLAQRVAQTFGRAK